MKIDLGKIEMVCRIVFILSLTVAALMLTFRTPYRYQWPQGTTAVFDSTTGDIVQLDGHLRHFPFTDAKK